MDILTLILFFCMGIIFGLIGAGGSILTIPILVYTQKVPALLATTYSLLIVACTSFLGVIQHRQEIHPQRALIFAVPSTVGVFITRFYLLPLIPPTFYGFSRDTVLLSILSFIMMGAGRLMIKPVSLKTHHPKLSATTYLEIILTGFALGLLMGGLGIGGGFLMTPVMVLRLGLPVRQAMATSLLIILINTAVGFMADRHHLVLGQYQQLLIYTSLALSGMWIGTHINKRISEQRLKIAFGIALMMIALLMLVTELFFQ